ncbi:WAT1-related protein At5g40240-like isoform X3 [Tasmannia lanceolata]|uniref:WAT1-related protein At5g40240-like isoform X3 n=1 Tax=Tasmannia lanceolata TaxID=3420 RepID=UPI0040638CD9
MMCLWDVLPYAAMVIVEIFSVGMTTLSKAAMSKRLSQFVFVLYSNVLTTIILIPAYFIFQRSRPPITFRLLCRFFLLGLAGITIMQNCDFTGINYSSPTLGSALSNLVPAFTFIIAVVFRVENVDIRSSRSQAKFLGILISISGAMVVTFYKGLPIRELDSWSPFPCNCLPIFFSMEYVPERDSSAWRLRPDIELISIAYSAVFGGVITCTVQTWCIHKKGPVFVAMFKPLRIAIAAIMGTIFLGDTLHLGSVIGAVIIAVGFYGVIWGQTREEKKGDDKIVNGLKSSSQTMPLLQSEMEI